jgi:hypothetical protein
MAIADEAGAAAGRVEARFPDPRRIRLRYDYRRDILTLLLMPAQPAVSTDLGGEGWVRIIPGTGEVVAVGVEDFRPIVLPPASPGFRGKLGEGGDGTATASRLEAIAACILSTSQFWDCVGREWR